MKGDIHGFAKIGIVQFMLWKDTIKGDGDHSSVEKILNDPYFDLVEVTRINNPETRKSVAGKIRASGKSVAFGAQPVLLTQKLDINHLDENERKKAVAGLFDVVPQAYELGAIGFAVLSGKNVQEVKRSHAMEQLIKSLDETATELEKRGDIPLVLEIFDQLGYGKNCLIGKSSDAAQIACEIRKRHPSFGLMIDLSHIPLQKTSAEETWELCGKYVVHAHMGNCVMDSPGHPMNGDEHPPFCDPAGKNGVQELAEYLKVLLEGGYLSEKNKKPLSFEVCIYGDLSRDEVLRQSKDVLEKAWNMIGE